MHINSCTGISNTALQMVQCTVQVVRLLQVTPEIWYVKAGKVSSCISLLKHNVNSICCTLFWYAEVEKVCHTLLFKRFEPL